MEKFNFNSITSDLFLFFDNMTSQSFTVLGSSSAVIAALLALTTIIFSQYNERLIQKTNSISNEIKNAITKKQNREVIIDKMNEMIFLLSNQFVYKITLYFFFFVSYISGFLWLIVGTGYLFDLDQKSSGNLLVVVLSIIITSATFFVLPIVLIQFNKSPALRVNIKNRISIDEVLMYFKSLNRITNEVVIKDFVDPTITFKLSYSGSLKVMLNQEIPTSNILYICELIGNDNNKEIIKIENNTSDNYIEYNVQSNNKNENNFEGLFSLFRESNFQKLYVYSKSSNEIKASYTMNLKINNESEIALRIDEEFIITPDEFISDIISSKKAINIYLDNENVVYDLKRHMEK